MSPRKPLRVVRSLAILLAAMAPACAGPDPCAADDGTCLAVHLLGDVSPIDAVRINLSGAAHLDATEPLPAGTHRPPLAVAIHLADGAIGTLVVGAVAESSGLTVGFGRGSVDVSPGDHVRLDVTLLAQPIGGCANSYADGDETDIDCGGSTCPPCAAELHCDRSTDCKDRVCKAGRCVAASCDDKIANGAEADVDCGHVCKVSMTGPIIACDDMRACVEADDCKSGVCTGKVCQAATCKDSAQNGDETDTDCGGSKCLPCHMNQKCAKPTDCVSGSCTGGRCDPVPTCSDQVKNQDETDVDCGGMTCMTRCAVGQACGAMNGSADCASGNCVNMVCRAPATCSDKLKDGKETDVDCGGGMCPGCLLGRVCVAHSDCASAYCKGGKCVAAACNDGIKDGAETDVDCGGGVCPRCAVKLGCAVSSDCDSGFCQIQMIGLGLCQPPPLFCLDGILDPGETDTDCGGMCPPCALGKKCVVNTDCVNNLCTGGRCQAASCANGKKDVGETDVDCGGTCAPCAKGKVCGKPADCVDAFCISGICSTDPCMNGVKDGKETDVDCGGGACAPCSIGKVCAVGTDCMTILCAMGRCALPPCMNGVKDGMETDVDCGGGACAACSSGRACMVGADCASMMCTNGACVGALAQVSFGPPIVVQGGGPAPWSALVIDQNGDGVADIVEAATGADLQGNNGGVWVFPGLGNGMAAFGPPIKLASLDGARYVIAGDWNHDGFQDYAASGFVAGGVAVILGANAKGAVQPPTFYPLAPGAFGLAAGDWNGDQVPDLAVASGGPNAMGPYALWILLGAGNGTFGVPVRTAANDFGGLAAGDLNIDGKLDLVLGASNGGNAVFFAGNGNGTFAAASVLPPAPGAGGVAFFPLIGDFTLDGKPDLAIGGLVDGLYLWPGPLQAPGTWYKAMGQGQQVVTADFDLDGRPDLAVCHGQNFGPIPASVLLNAKGFQFQPVTVLPMPQTAAGMAAGDLDHDGRPDLVIADSMGSVLMVLLNTSK